MWEAEPRVQPLAESGTAATTAAADKTQTVAKEGPPRSSGSPRAPVAAVLQVCVLDALRTSSRLLGAASALYLRRECRLLDWLRAMRRFLLGGDGDFFDALAHELHALARVGELDELRHGGQGELRRILTLALLRADASEAEHSDALVLSWRSDDAAAARPTPEGAAAEEAMTEHRIDAFDAVNLSMGVPPRLQAVIDTTQYVPVFRFVLRLRRASLALRTLWHDVRRAQASDMRPASERHRAVTHAMHALRLHARARSHFVRALEARAVVTDATWATLCADVAMARSAHELRDVHDSYLASICQRCALGEPSVAPLLAAILGVALALARVAGVRLAEGPASTAAAEWHRLVGASRAQLALLCHALGSSSSALASLSTCASAPVL